MSDSPLAPQTSPLLEADPNSLNELIQERINDIFNTPPLQLTDDKLRVAVEYFRRERERFVKESAEKPQRTGPRKKTPTSVSEALSSSADLL
jgi:hypothetical protein